MSFIQSLLGGLNGLLRQLDNVAEGRIQHAVRCPQCDHSALEASPDCPCWDPGCQCVVLHEEKRWRDRNVQE